MHPHLPARRQFLQRSVLAAGACWAFDALPAHAIEPISRPEGAHFKFSLAAYSYRRLLQGKEASLTLHDFVDDCAKMGLDGTELTSYYFPADFGADYVYSLKHHCFRVGLDVSGTAVRNDFGYPEGDPERKRWIEHVKQWVDHSHALGAPVIRIFAGHQKQGISAEQSHRLMVDGMQECSEYAGRRGVFLALENHGGPTASVDGLLALVRDVKSPWFGVNLDTGNFHSETVYEDLATAAPYALNVQVKVVYKASNGEKQPMDFDRLAKLLRDAGYRGYVVLEYEESGDPREECPKYLDQLRTAFQA